MAGSVDDILSITMAKITKVQGQASKLSMRQPSYIEDIPQEQTQIRQTHVHIVILQRMSMIAAVPV